MSESPTTDQLTPRVNRPQGIRRPLTIAARVDADELRAIRIAAAKANVRVADWLRAKIIPAALDEAA